MFKAGLRSNDLSSLPPELINFFPSQALSRLPKDVFKSFNNDQLQNLNIEQIKTIPNSLLNSLNSKQMAIINQIRYPFKSTGLFSLIYLIFILFINPKSLNVEELIKFNQKSNSVNEWNESGRNRISYA